MISLIFRIQNYKKIDVRGYPQTRISLSKDDSLSKDCPWMICPWTISYFTHIFCPISVQGQSLDNFTYISYAKLQKNRCQCYPQIFIDNLSNLKYYNIIKS